MKYISKEILVRKLKALQKNLAMNTSKTSSLILSLNEAYEDRRQFYMNYYAQNNSPLKVSALDITESLGNDITGMMLDFSIGYELYFSKLESEISKLRAVRDDSMMLFQEIISLPTNYCRVMYFMYVKGYSAEDCQKRLFVSKSTFYRYRTKAIEMLCENYEKALLREIA